MIQSKPSDASDRTSPGIRAAAVAGAWLWQGRQRGARLGLATIPLAGGLGAGFALPFLLIGLPIKVILILAGRRGLR